MSNAPGSDFNLVVQRGRGGAVLRLSGTINESFQRNRLVDAVDGGVVVLDLSEVRRITSYGVREWVEAMRAFSADYLGFLHARPAMVTQFNSVADFAGSGELLSFYAPYVCESCGRDFELLIDSVKQSEQIRELAAPPATCPDCQGSGQLDELPDTYFSYLASVRVPNPPHGLEALLTQPNLPLKIEKDVQGTVTSLWLSGNLERGPSLKRIADGLEGEVVVCAEEVGNVTEEGIARLKLLLSVPGALFTLIRLPPALVSALASSPGALGASSVASVGWPYRCAGCGAEARLDVDKDKLARPLPSSSCVRCGMPFSPIDDPQLRAAALALTWTRPAGDLARHLATLRGPPSRPPTAPPVAETAPAPTGSQVFGRYLLLRPIGAGGMAETFLARQTGLGGFEKNIVVKRILPNLSRDQNFVQMFLQEARLAARITHPNVVQIFDVGQVGSQFYIAMEYVRGWDLNGILRVCQRLSVPFPLELAYRVVADICAGLHEAHTCTDEDGRSLALIHRDVSPHNVLVSVSGQVKLTDFGIAKAVDSRELTPTATMKGKLSYMAPEQVAEGGVIDARVDIFPAGLILYQLLTLEHLFRRETEFATLKAILHDPVPRIRSRRPEAPAELELVLDRALARNASDRYSSARELQAELERLIGTSGKPSTSTELSRWLSDLMQRARVMGELPPDMSFTPTADVRTATHSEKDETTPTGVTPTSARGRFP